MNIIIFMGVFLGIAVIGAITKNIERKTEDKLLKISISVISLIVAHSIIKNPVLLLVLIPIIFYILKKE